MRRGLQPAIHRLNTTSHLWRCCVEVSERVHERTASLVVVRCVNGGLLTSAGRTNQRADRLWSVVVGQCGSVLLRCFKQSKSELAGRGRLLVARRAATTAAMTATVTAATHPVCVSRCLSNFLKRDREAECAADDRCCVKWCALCLTWTSSPLASRRQQVRR